MLYKNKVVCSLSKLYKNMDTVKLINIVGFQTGWQFVTLISPIFVYLLLTKVIVINMLETSADEKWGTDEEYQRYKRETPVLLPFT